MEGSPHEPHSVPHVQSVIDELSPKLDSIPKICKQAGNIVRSHFGKISEVEHKGAIDLVTIADRKSEEFILKELTKLFPSHTIVAEESFDSGIGTDRGSTPSGFRWLIDPLDGTTNFAHTYPHYCTSMGLEYDGEPIFGVIYAPVADELFTGARGHGASMNGSPITVSSVSKVSRSILATGFPYDRRTNPNDNVSNFSKMINRVQGIRRGGSAALDLCYLACGRIDGFWELRLKPWDVAAGVVIVKEACGKVTNIRGERFDIYKDDILATNGHLHGEMRTILND